MSIAHPHHYTKQIPEALYTAEQTRQLDRTAIEEQGIPGFELMSRAGRVAFNVLKERWPHAKHIMVFCGAGNNGGDGYVIASLARRAGIQVKLIQVAPASKLKGDALTAYEQAVADQVPMEAFSDQTQISGELVVDALLGTGLKGDVRGLYHDAIIAIQRSSLPVLAVDIPSGLAADTGHVLGVALQAQVTVTFIGMKQGLLTGRAPQLCGDIYYGRLGVSDEVFQAVPQNAIHINTEFVSRRLPARPRDAHKGQNGHVLIVGGDFGMGGAAAMAAEAAGRCGAGLVTVVTRPDHVPAILARRPECMVLGCDEGRNIDSVLEKVSVVVAGPGIGRGRWGAFLLEQVLVSELPVVLDADGLNYLAALAEQSPDAMARGNWVLTPHPGEAARLLGTVSSSIQEQRFTVVEQLVSRFAGVSLLKGAGTLVKAHGKLPRVINTGNPGMASGGMGDVLSGVIGALIAQGLSLADAASVGAWVHGKAADIAAQKDGERGLLATDLMKPLQQLVNHP